MNSVNAINAFNDNYIWCIVDATQQRCALVDPGDADVCIDYIEKNQLTLTNILITHHHQDHVGGLAKLIQYAKSANLPLTVYGPASENIKQLDVALKENDQVNILNQQFSVFDIPGHTSGHIAYLCNDVLFCGDTLFSGGCGRLFEGTAAQMHHSLAKLAKLPNDTKVYCAHEYTLANLDFARTIEPKNSHLSEYYDKVIKLRAENRSTIPTTIGIEKQINPFLRSEISDVKYIAEQKSSKTLSNPVQVFAIIRELKDNF